MEFLHFLNIIFFLSSQVENQETPVNLFFLYFPAKIFEFSFNHRRKIGWPPRHLDRVLRVEQIAVTVYKHLNIH